MVLEAVEREEEMNKALKIIFHTVLFTPLIIISGCAFPLGWDDSGRKYPIDTLLQGTEKSQGVYEVEARGKYVNEHPELSPKIKEHLLSSYGEPIKGMNKEQVQLYSQFSRHPDKVMATKRYGADEMWIFNNYPEDPSKRVILYFKSDVLVDYSQ